MAKRRPAKASNKASWEQRLSAAQAEVQTVLASLPSRLRQPAQALPISYEPKPGSALVTDGIEPDTLGLFVGAAYADGPHAILPAQIILFLDNIWEMVGGDMPEFQEEVRITLLHELGHYLGLDEAELTERGLE